MALSHVNHVIISFLCFLSPRNFSASLCHSTLCLSFSHKKKKGEHMAMSTFHYTEKYTLNIPLIVVHALVITGT